MFRITDTVSGTACSTPGVMNKRKPRLLCSRRGVQSINRTRCYASIEVGIRVEGMTCKHCTASVETALKESADVVEVKQVDLKSGIASVLVDADSPKDALDKAPGLCQAIDAIGFAAEPCSGGATALGADS